MISPKKEALQKDLKGFFKVVVSFRLRLLAESG